MIWSWAAVLRISVYLTNVCANVSECIKAALLCCNISVEGLPCYWLYLWPLTGVLRQHRQLSVWLLINWNRRSVWPPNTVFTRNQERQWLQLLRKIVLATPPPSLWNSDTSVEFPLFCWSKSQSLCFTLPVLPACLDFQFNIIIQRPLSDSKTKFVTT